MIIGAPGETRNLIKKTRPDYLSTANLRVYPGTALWKQAQDEGLCDDSFFLTDQECLHYTGAMSVPQMFQTAREYLLLHAGLNGLSGYVTLAKFGFHTLRQTPRKAVSGLLPWQRRS